MRFLFMAVLGCLGLSPACAEWTVQGREVLGELPVGAVAWQCTVSGTEGNVRLNGVSFSAAKATFRVVDNPPEARQAFAGILGEVGAVAGMNGG